MNAVLCNTAYMRRPYPEFARRYLARNLLLFTLLAVIFFLVWRRWGTFDVLSFLLIGLVVAGVIFGLVWDRRRLSNFHCPQCGRTVSEPTVTERVEGDSIEYSCPTFDIIWETGLREGGD